MINFICNGCQGSFYECSGKQPPHYCVRCTIRILKAHESMLEALKGLERAVVELIEAEEPTSTDWVNVRASCVLARAAIAAGEGGG